MLYGTPSTDIDDVAILEQIHSRRDEVAAGVDQRTATRDLARPSSLGLLEPHGQGPGRFHLATRPFREALRSIRRETAAIEDPCPGFISRVRRPAEGRTHARHDHAVSGARPAGRPRTGA